MGVRSLLVAGAFMLSVPGFASAAVAPVATSATVQTTQGVSLPVQLSATGAPGTYLRYILLSHPLHGILLGKEPNITYVPNTDFVGTDSFTFKVNDRTRDSNIATITIVVASPAQKTGLVSAAAATPSSIVSGTTPFDQGFVSLTFDDGLLNQYQNALPILDAAGMKGSFYIITHLSGMAIANPNLEVTDPASSTKPQGWTTSGGSKASFKYPVTGISGKAVETTSSVTNSKAAWYFTPVTVMGDEEYTYDDAYRSTAPSDIVIQMTDASGTLRYINANGDAVTTLTPALTLTSTAGVWVTMPPLQFYVPPNIKKLTVLHRLTGIGTLDVDSVSLTAPQDYMTPSQVLSLQADGQEVGGHTQTHPDLTTLSTADQTTEIAGGRQDLISTGVTPAETFVYPYGTFTATTQQIVQQAGYLAARSVSPDYNNRNASLYGLLAESIYSDTTPAQVENWIDQAVANKQWLIIVFHPILADLTNELYGMTPTNFQTIVNYLKTKNIPVLTMDQGAALIRNRTNSAPVATNSSVSSKPNTSAPVVLNVTDPDNDPLVYTIVQAPAHGTLVGTLAARTYVPVTGFTGTDSFTFKANDGLLDSNISTVSITVSASATTSSQNLVLNPSFVTANPQNSRLPLNWSQGGWGTNTVTYTYPVTGKTDSKAAKVQITSYTSGDAKWVPNDVTAVPGHTYTYADSYISNIPSHIEAQYTDANQNTTYSSDTYIPASTSWGVSGVTFTVPAGTVSVSVFHYIAGVGSLTLDDASLFDVSSTTSVTTPTTPSITLTPSTLPGGTVNKGYGQTLTASTTASGPFTWSVSAGALPTGLTLGASTGTTDTITGTTTTAGTYSFSITVTNGVSSTTQAYSVTVTTPTTPSITLTPSTLPGGTVNKGYGQTLTASTTASGPFTWSVSAGALPTGLTLGASTGTTDTITGTTTTAGTYSFSITVTNGVSSTTQAYSVAVTAVATSTNLVLNPSFITPDPLNAAFPQYWSQGGWGTNTHTFTYPVTGQTDAMAAKVQITAYTSGDEKWVMQGIPVIAGKSYTYTDSYQSNIASYVEAEYLSTTGTYSYSGAVSVPASSATWSTATLTVTPPAGTASIRIFHYISGIGWLTIDDTSVVQQ